MIFNIKDLIKPSVIGFYKRCEVVQISYYEGQHENENNIFTLLIFDELEYDGKHEQYLTNNKNKVLPDIDGIQSIECTTHGTLDGAESGTAKYIIQMKIKYYKEA